MVTCEKYKHDITRDLGLGRTVTSGDGGALVRREEIV